YTPDPSNSTTGLAFRNRVFEGFFRRRRFRGSIGNFGRGRKERKPSGKPSSKRELGFDGSSANPSSIQLLPRVLPLVPLGLKSSLMNFSQPSIRLSPLTRSR